MCHELNNINENFDKPKDECGVFGAFAPIDEIGKLTYYGLYALQHRGQESAGIVTGDGENFKIQKGLGLCNEVFDDKGLSELTGKVSIGHVRYSTSGDSSINNTQPLYISGRLGKLAFSHNGNLVNSKKLKYELEEEGTIFQTTTDSEILAHLIAKSKKDNIVDALRETIPEIKGSYSFLVVTPSKLIGIRDPNGIRPLSLGKIGEGYVLASETCAFDTIGARFVRDIDPGEMVVIDEQGIRSIDVMEEQKSSLCIFEYIYLSIPDSNLYGRNVHLVRKELGRQLAREYPVKADVVTGVPDSSLSAASGVSEELGISYEMGLIKNRYVGRTFIQPTQKLRELGVKLKLNPVNQTVDRQRLILVDDSIVRGTTSMKIVQMLKDAGAKEVHVLISSPPITHPCYLGIDTSSKGELIGAEKDAEGIREAIGADSLGFLSKEGMIKAVESIGGTKDGFCTACFDGDYPTKLVDIEWAGC